MATEETKFDLQVVHDNFLSSLTDEDDIFLKYYLDSYDELNKFFTLMGTVFGFVSNDLKSKMDILNEFLNGEQSSYFETVKKMIEYERDNNLLKKGGYVSGSRTLLRLHRGLDFIRLFLKKVSELQEEDNTAHVCRLAYDQTLAEHHTYLIRMGAKLAMCAMPTRGQLLRKVCGDEEENIKQAMEVLPRMLDVTATVYDRIDNLYTKYNLHTLP